MSVIDSLNTKGNNSMGSTPPKDWFKVYMSIVGPLTNLMFYIQGYEIFHTRSAGAVSILGFTISIIGLGSWLAYGVYLKNTPLIVANVVGTVGALLVVIGALVYG